MNPGRTGKAQGTVWHSVVAILLVARAVQSGVVFKDSKQVIAGLGRGEGGGWMEVGVWVEKDGEWGSGSGSL